MELKGAVVVVTGAARGIGKSISQAFAERGAKVALVDISQNPVQEIAQELKVAGGVVVPIVTDITKKTEVEAMVHQTETELGPIDILINNAGTFSVIGPVWEIDSEKWFRDIKVNLYGTFLCCQAVVKGMTERKKGYVLNAVSTGGVNNPQPYFTSYSSSKTGLMKLTEGLATEVKDHGIKVFAYSPPAVDTDMTKFILNDPGGRKWKPEFKKIFEDGKDGPPEDVAKLILELVSGNYDALHGCFFDAMWNMQEIRNNIDTILKDELLKLRFRVLPGLFPYKKR